MRPVPVDYSSMKSFVKPLNSRRILFEKPSQHIIPQLTSKNIKPMVLCVSYPLLPLIQRRAISTPKKLIHHGKRHTEERQQNSIPDFHLKFATNCVL